MSGADLLLLRARAVDVHPVVRVILAVAAVTAIVGCGEQGAAPATVGKTTTPPALACPVPDQAGVTGSALLFSGACGFSQRAVVACAKPTDDFRFRFTRMMTRELTIYVNVTVEEYEGPGTYRGTTSIIVEIPNRNTLYEWSTRTASAVIDKDGVSGVIPRTALAPAIGTPTRGTEYVEGPFTCRPAP
jgi:hypothetical protein